MPRHTVKIMFAVVCLNVHQASGQDWQFLGLENQSIRAIAINPENSNEIYVGDGFTGGSLGGD